MKVEVSDGEIADRLSILEIKRERADDPVKILNIERELGVMRDAWNEVKPSRRARVFFRRLKKVNLKLWKVEDDIRVCERSHSFGTRFVRLARSVYRLNDGRSEIKRQINDEMKSLLIEEKIYAHY